LIQRQPGLVFPGWRFHFPKPGANMMDTAEMRRFFSDMLTSGSVDAFDRWKQLPDSDFIGFACAVFVAKTKHEQAQYDFVQFYTPTDGDRETIIAAVELIEQTIGDIFGEHN
jgi:hypothetical protein